MCRAPLAQCAAAGGWAAQAGGGEMQGEVALEYFCVLLIVGGWGKRKENARWSAVGRWNLVSVCERSW